MKLSLERVSHYRSSSLLLGLGVTALLVLPSVTSAAPKKRTKATAPAPVVYQCSDNLDNDGDGLIDPSDPGCSGASDNSETNYTSAPPPPPPPPSPSTCADSVDYIDSTYGYRVRQLATSRPHMSTTSTTRETCGTPTTP